VKPLLTEAADLSLQVSIRLEEIRARIKRAGGDPDAIEIVAVTKTFGPAACLAAHMAGLSSVGENYAGELLGKHSALGKEAKALTWHYLGAVQRNKVGRLAPVVSCWQGLSRPIEARAIAEKSPAEAPAVFVEVNLSTSEKRGGAPPALVPEAVAAAREEGLLVRGLMAVAPLPGEGPGPEAAFSEVARLAESLGLFELSIGMSGDLEAAVQAGSTMIRVGRGLFGPRDPHAAG
jgi:uncharacterized pyridoxal phosphate-containing UPF0001 family protein